jgi:hypothetical protein
MAQPVQQKPATASRSRRSDDPALGKVIAGRYRLEARIGEGGMGIVYRARHVLIDRVVAVKLIRPDLRGETHLRAWMLREARAANRVDHAHIIDIHDIGETDEGELYLVMEYLVGTPLSTELARGPLPLARGVDVLEQMGAALTRAHDLGVVHRDLKSDNILLTQRGGRKDFVKILDFGLAALAHDPRLAPKGAVFGTPEYMSPEQARGEEDVVALQVAMDDAEIMGARERRAHLLEHIDGASELEWSARELRRKRSADQVLHHQIEFALVRLADVVDVDDVRVIDPVRGARLSQHPRAEVRFPAQVRPDQLDGDDSIDEHVAGAVHDAHAALTDARLEPIAAGDDLAKRGIVRPLT